MKKNFYVTTAIDYVNAEPHVGHAFEKTLADSLARWHRLKGDDVFFLTGVDENAQKNVQAAEKARLPVKKFIDKNTGLFKELCDKLNISYDEFVRTGAKEHGKIVQRIVRKLLDKKDVYKSFYEGLYCIGCETYYTEKELIDGKCPEHHTKPELRKEDAYFFKLSKYKKELLKIIPNYIVPESRAKEVLTRVKEDGLHDICISRKGAKWGVDFPDDKNYKIWVWVDALINYISGLKDKEKKYWPAQTHVVGKGVNWFHSVIWPAILLSAGYKLPEKLLVHGYLNLGGQKMSKSLGNTINPLKLVEKYGTDSVRYALLRCSVFEDSDFSEEILIERHNNELANKLGNLVSRVEGLIEKFGVEKTDNKFEDKLKIGQKIKNSFDVSYPRGEIHQSKLKEGKLVGASHISIAIATDNGKTVTPFIIEVGENINKFKSLLPFIIDKCFERYELDKALKWIFSFLDYCNWYVQEKKPWETKDKKVLYELKESILKISELLSPFLPETSEKIKKKFSGKIKKSEILFKKII